MSLVPLDLVQTRATNYPSRSGQGDMRTDPPRAYELPLSPSLSLYLLLSLSLSLISLYLLLGLYLSLSYLSIGKHQHDNM